MSEEEKQEKKDQTAKDVAEVMLENMIKNMDDPDFFNKREKIKQEATDEILKRREERRKRLKEE